MTMEKRLQTLEASIKVIAQYVKEQTQKIENEMFSIKNAPTDMPHDSNLQQELDELKKRLDIVATGATAPAPMDDERLRKSLQSMRADFDNFKMEFSPKMQYMERKTDKLKEIVDGSIGSSDFEDLKRWMEKIDKKVNETLALKEELDDAEETMTKMKGIANRLKDFDAASYREEFDKHLNQMREQMREIENHDLKSVSAKLDHLENIEAGDLKKMTEMSEELKKFEVDDIKKIRRMEMHDISKISDMLEKFKDIEGHDIKSLAKKMKDTTDALEDEQVNRISFDKRIDDMESNFQRLKNFEDVDMKKVKNLVDHFSYVESDDMKKIKEMVEQLKSMEIHDIGGLTRDIKRTKDLLEDEAVTRQAAEKRLRDVEATTNQMKRTIETIENIEGLDISKMNSRLQEIEGGMKMAAVKFLTQQLNDFTKSLDRKIPNIVSREEYVRQIADMNQRIRTIEAPDLAPLGMRVGRLESKIEEIANMMRSMYNRIPIVVE